MAPEGAADRQRGERARRSRHRRLQQARPPNPNLRNGLAYMEVYLREVLVGDFDLWFWLWLWVFFCVVYGGALCAGTGASAYCGECSEAATQAGQAGHSGPDPDSGRWTVTVEGGGCHGRVMEGGWRGGKTNVGHLVSRLG